MRIYDISMQIEYDMPVYKNRAAKRPLLSTVQDFSTGSCFESRIDMDMHTGTHIDAPLHMIENGGTIEKLDLKSVITRCKVFDFSCSKEKITSCDLREKDISEGDFVLLKTRNSFEDILSSGFVFLDITGAEYLESKRVIGVGIDALGIERSQPGHPTHNMLLGSGIVILEGLRLSEVPEGEYLLNAAPLNIVGAEAAPVRAVLICY